MKKGTVIVVNKHDIPNVSNKKTTVVEGRLVVKRRCKRLASTTRQDALA
jgi:hypothetical protein